MPARSHATARSRPGLAAAALVTMILAVVATGTLLVRVALTDTTAGPPVTASATTNPTPSAVPGGTGSSGTATAGGTAPANPVPLAAPLTPTGDREFDAEALEVARFVEQTRGHPFREPVHVELAEGAAFERRALADFEESVPEIRRTESALKALGILPPSTDLVQITRDSNRAGIAGFYDPVTKELVVRGAASTPLTRSILAHELTHALDDQWFPLGATGGSDAAQMNQDAAYGHLALVEGSSSRVETAWTSSRSPEERAAILTEADATFPPPRIQGMPIDVVQIIASPYSLGEDFVDGLVAHGGNAALDAAFLAPPTSSEQVMHLSRFLTRDEPHPVPLPPSDGETIAEGVLGELGFTQFLSAGLAPVQARAAGAGWAGDRYVVWRTAGGGSCLRDDVVLDSDADATELVDAIRDWAGQHPAASVERRSARDVRFTSCS